MLKNLENNRMEEISSVTPTPDINEVTSDDHKTSAKVRADSRFAHSQWEMSLQNNGISHWLGANLESELILGLRTANERCRYKVTASLIGCAKT